MQHDLARGFRLPYARNKFTEDLPVADAADPAASLAVVDLFDRDYVGVVRAGYYPPLSGASAIYYPAAPRTPVAKLSLDF